ncbi:hypothetical protein Rhow_004699 [Rhodococcus wratislaviensis]|uniref:Uncharacterized protein n=1 Tax=Rhodococcus wratislaviensis TaxID=44752 RepID=A0A402BZI4_RHOWR|nr:hypothetical protein Rhow_004699 [Rhodococcus wratislaviensis]
MNFLRFVDISSCGSFLVTTVYKKCHTPNPPPTMITSVSYCMAHS